MQTVRVRLRKPTRVFTFLCKNIPLERNEHCIVRSDRGLEYGTCVLPPDDCAEEMKERYKMTVVRRATPHDDKTYDEIRIDEGRAKSVCIDKIKQRKLAMKMVDVEYTFDRRKIVFYFTAEDRVDFRELVRDLAHELKARIELRHIQVRDEAKIVGGIGTCGRELCCTSWMTDFMPISMKMAKKQNLSLNPSKISGQCGRLMCCLSYENEMYVRAKRSAKPGTPAPKPKELAKVRDAMEAGAQDTVKILKKTNLKDVAVEAEAMPEPAVDDAAVEAEQETVVPEISTNEPVEREAQAPQATPEEGTQEKEEGGASGDSKPGDAAKAEEPHKKKRRRRKKNRGKGKGKGNR